MSNTRRPAKSQPATKTKAAKKKTAAKRQPIAMVPTPAAVPDPHPESITEFGHGPVAVPDVRQEGRYVYGIIQSRDPISVGRMGIGGTGELIRTTWAGSPIQITLKRLRCNNSNFLFLIFIQYMRYNII